MSTAYRQRTTEFVYPSCRELQILVGTVKTPPKPEAANRRFTPRCSHHATSGALQRLAIIAFSAARETALV